MSQTDRDILFANEAFLIGVLQAVSGGSLIAALSQTDALVAFAGKKPFLAFLTAMVISLLAAVLAAYWKHEYKMWDVKGQASSARGEAQEAKQRGALAGTNLWQMRWSMRVALVGILLGFVILTVAIWVRA
jgi:hypothetical protein